MARLLALHLLLRRLAAGRPRAAGREAERGQAVAEFAITVSLVLAVAVTALQMVPAISARGRVLDAAATATERAARYLAPGGLAPSDQRKDLCGQIRALLVAQLPAAGLPVTGSATGCAVPASGHRLAPTAGENLAVWVSALDPKSGEADPSLRLDPDAGGAGRYLEAGPGMERKGQAESDPWIRVQSRERQDRVGELLGRRHGAAPTAGYRKHRRGDRA